MVVALIGVLLAALIQLALALHVRNTLIMCASEGARVAARAGAAPADGQARAGELVSASLGATFPRQIAVGRTERAGMTTIEVVVAAPLPLLGLLGPAHMLQVTGRSVAEAAS